MKHIGIIPARYASTRFPGKPLALIGGKPMIERVYEQASKALETVVVATDDERIYRCVEGFGGKVVMTRTDHRCGTERCLEAWEKISDRYSGKDTVIINIQGDEPFIQPEQIEALKSCFEGADNVGTKIATLVKPFTLEDGLQALENPNTPKVAVAWNGANGNKTGKTLLFSRSVIPYMRGVEKEKWLEKGQYYKHIGMYAYRTEVLKEITALQPTPLETAESLEQLRWLENGYEIRVAACDVASIGIDTPDDLKKAEEYIEKQI